MFFQVLEKGKGNGKGVWPLEGTPVMTMLPNTDECFMVALTRRAAKWLVHF